MTRATTDRGDFVFAIKEHIDHSPFIMLETCRKGLAVLGDGFLSLEMREDVSFEQAKELAALLNEQVEAVSHTKFIE